ncbi:MAG TPA: acyl-CoA dehydrogenase family protein [Deltaproteobacteria bacterium]|nr:acyl-CoA dehydrogenase family protein [Deltaproteobacteria bacterium]HPR54527.1 acyl-CoA dehydrogenase family protein [Deltaproteobacteria bacterium]HXK47393.1 acyl-CoA dehydrogenase family protein [Deltaproteobacteria bacterium]
MNRNVDDLFPYPREWMDDECSDMVRLVRQWSDREIVSRRMEYRENYETLFDVKRRKLDIDIGLQKLLLPSDAGGLGWCDPGRAPGMLALASEIGRADASAGVLFASMCSTLALFSMEHNYRAALCDSISEMFSGDELKTAAVILPGAGHSGTCSPLFKGRSILAVLRGDMEPFTVSGEGLRPLFAGGMADLFCIVCAAKDGKPCIAIVPGNAGGVRRDSALLTTGLNACSNADIHLCGVEVSRENIIERDGAVEELYTWLNLLLGGVSTGAAINFFELLSDWSDSRVIKGRTTLKENPLCASVLADVAEEIALARLLLHDLSHIIAGPGGLAGSSAVRTFTFAEMIGSRAQQGVVRAMNRGLELMGSAGYAREWHVEKNWRDVKTIQSVLCGVGAEVPVKMDTARFFYNCTEV